PMIGALFAIGVAIARSAERRNEEPVLDEQFFESGPDQTVLDAYNSVSYGTMQTRSEFGDLISGLNPRLLWSHRIRAFASEAIGTAMKAFMMTSRLTGISA
ncbi:MAG: hypothetical protein KC649_07415, partial [Candidatus Omnitrophica bacterium]|nr:hypothetical protein [Candidatus Omnitrophota bacterium]